MSTIQPNQQTFSMQDLRNLREAFDGTDSSASKSFVAAPNDGLQDVLILTPQEKGLVGGGVDQMKDSLTKSGVQVKEAIDTTGVTARISADQAKQLSDKGYTLIDDSPRELLPELPQASTKDASKSGASAKAGKSGKAKSKSTKTGKSQKKDEPTKASGGSKWALPDVDPVKMTHADDLQKKGLTGKGTITAVLDSGFDHPDYNSKILKWDDIASNNKTFHDGAGHGTHVVSDILKTAPDTGIIAIKVMGDDGKGKPSDIIKGLHEVAQLKKSGMNITTVNMSLGGQLIPNLPSSQNPIDQAVNQLHDMGVTVVAAAGNSGHTKATIGAPAEATGAIAVGSVLNPQTISDFSSGGPTVDGNVKPDFDAPGEFIKGWSVPYSDLYKTGEVVQTLRDMSGDKLKTLLTQKPQLIKALGLPADIATKSPDEVEEGVKPKLPPIYLTSDGQLAAPGTSFAAPLTTGVINDLEQAKPTSPDQIAALLKETAHKVGNEPASVQGAGLIDGAAANRKQA